MRRPGLNDNDCVNGGQRTKMNQTWYICGDKAIDASTRRKKRYTKESYEMITTDRWYKT